jgi:hypothetical protein
MGAIGFAYHFTEFNSEVIWVELLRLIAIVCGVYILRGHNWARWLALAWIGYHVIPSAFHTLPELAIHSVVLAILAYLLFRRTAAGYFRAAQ